MRKTLHDSHSKQGNHDEGKSATKRFSHRPIVCLWVPSDQLKECHLPPWQLHGAGWKLLFKVEGTGKQVLELEQQAFAWLRGELGLGVALSRLEMGSAGGETETFTLEGPSNQEVIDYIERCIQEIKSVK